MLEYVYIYRTFTMNRIETVHTSMYTLSTHPKHKLRFQFPSFPNPICLESRYKQIYLYAYYSFPYIIAIICVWVTRWSHTGLGQRNVTRWPLGYQSESLEHACAPPALVITPPTT